MFKLLLIIFILSLLLTILIAELFSKKGAIIKTIKITKKMMLGFEEFLIGCSAVNGKKAFPSYVWVTNKTYKKLCKKTKMDFKKSFKTLNKLQADFSIKMHMLNLAPNVIKGNGLNDAYVLVDDIKIKDYIEFLEENR